jgi:xanthine dehydrogenase accessory factor
MPWKTKILLIGAGDKGTASAVRLFRSGFRPIFLERTHPTDLHYNRNFTDAVYRGEKEVESIVSVQISCNQFNDQIEQDIKKHQDNRQIPLLCYDDVDIISKIKPEIIVDCTSLHTTPLQLNWQDFPCVIRIGTCYNVGVDGHMIIVHSGEHIGKVLRKPHNIENFVKEKSEIVHAPIEGIFIAIKTLGEYLNEREIIGTINDINIMAPSAGYLTGLLHSGHFIACRQPLCEISPAYRKSDLKMVIPAENYAIAGGVLEAILSFLTSRREKLDCLD